MPLITISQCPQTPSLRAKRGNPVLKLVHSAACKHCVLNGTSTPIAIFVHREATLLKFKSQVSRTRRRLLFLHQDLRRVRHPSCLSTCGGWFARFHPSDIFLTIKAGRGHQIRGLFAECGCKRCVISEFTNHVRDLCYRRACCEQCCYFARGCDS